MLNEMVLNKRSVSDKLKSPIKTMPKKTNIEEIKEKDQNKVKHESDKPEEP